MATVYLAEDVKHHRKVAVKVLRPELAAKLGRDRFLREIELAAKLEHPHILTLIDSGEADGFLYFVMPYVDGESLRQRLAQEGELPIADAVRVLRDVVDALSHAHANGIVHRDIKPDNVMLMAQVVRMPALLTDYRPSVPPALADLLMRCLEKQAADRWQTADELLAHVEAIATPSGRITPAPIRRSARHAAS